IESRLYIKRPRTGHESVMSKSKLSAGRSLRHRHFSRKDKNPKIRVKQRRGRALHGEIDAGDIGTVDRYGLIGGAEGKPALARGDRVAPIRQIRETVVSRTIRHGR